MINFVGHVQYWKLPQYGALQLGKMYKPCPTAGHKGWNLVKDSSKECLWPGESTYIKVQPFCELLRGIKKCSGSKHKDFLFLIYRI